MSGPSLEKNPHQENDVWHKVRTKIYYAEYRRGKAGELVDCWAYKHKLREGEIVIRRPNGDIAIASEGEFFSRWEEVSE